MNNTNYHKNLSGFTLIELMVIVVIIAGLATVTFGSIADTRANARNNARHNDLNILKLALSTYELNHNSLPFDLDQHSYVFGTSSTDCDLQCGFPEPEPYIPPPPPEPIVETVTLYATHDATIYQYQGNSNFGNQTTLETYPWSPSYSKRFYLKFDYSTLPQNLTINNAKVRIKQAGTYGQTRQLNMHLVTGANWNEGTITWNNSPTFFGTPTASAYPSWNGVLYTSEWNVTSDVENMLFLNQNYGWVVKDNLENSSQHYWRFTSSEGTTKPELVITYTIESEPEPEPQPEPVIWQPSNSCYNIESNPNLAKYLPTIPIDPLGDPEINGYGIYKSDENVILRACYAEKDKVIELAL